MNFTPLKSRHTAVVTCIFAAGISAIPAQALPLKNLDIPETAVTCYVQAGARANGNGSIRRPYNSLANVESDSNCEVILVKMSRIENLALDGGIRLKDGQKLFGLGPDVTRPDDLRERRPLITNTNATDDDFFGPDNFGAGVILANDNEVAGVHIDATHNAAIWAANVSDAHIHKVLITNANTSSDPVQQNITGGEAAAINIYAAPFLGTIYIGPAADTSLSLVDTVVRGGQLAVQQTAAAQVAEVSIEHLIVDRPGPSETSLESGQPVGGVSSIALAGGQAKVSIHGSKFIDVDNLGNRYPVILSLAQHDNSQVELQMSSSIIINASPMSDFDPQRPKGDGVTVGAFGARAQYSLSNVSIVNAGQDGFEALANALGPSASGSAPFVFNQASEVTGSLSNVEIVNAGRFGAIGVIEQQSTDSPAGSFVGIAAAKSTITGAGSVEFWGNNGWNTAGIAAVYIDQTGERPVSPGSEWKIDFGTAGQGSGNNRVFSNNGPDILVTDVGTPLRRLVLNAARNWWGSPEEVMFYWLIPDEERYQPEVVISASSRVDLITNPTLTEDPIGDPTVNF